MKYVFVVTNVDHGWDCVCGVYENRLDAYTRCFNGNHDNLTIEQMIDIVECGDTQYVVSAKKLE